MSRSIAEIKSDLENLFPVWWTDNAIGLALVTGIATVLAAREALFDGVGGWLEQMLTTTAAGFWLDEHGADYGFPRYPGESDLEYRARIRWAPQVLTAGNAVEELSRPLPGEGYSVVVEEPFSNVLGAGFFLDNTSSILTDARELDPDPRFLFWIFIPLPEVEYLLDSFLGIDLFLGVESYLDETIDDLNRRHIRQIFEIADARRGYGVAWGVTVADLVQLPYLDGLFDTGSGGYV